jgi:streptogramin lyase
MDTRMMSARRVPACVFAALIAACSGNATFPSATKANGDTVNSARANERQGAARIELRIPKPNHRALYVSPNTRSIGIVANGKTIGKYNTTPSSRGCSTVDKATQCSFTIGVPTGTVTFVVSTYSSTNVLLGSGTVRQKIAAGKLAVIPLTLEGVVKSVTVSLGDNSPAAGTPANVPVFVTAFDPSGAAIIGPGNYGTAIKLTDSDTTGITSLSPTTVRGPGAKVTLAYNGRSIFHATIGAAGASNVTSTTFAPTPRIFASYTTIAGAQSAAYAITAGPDGNVWYTTRSCSLCSASTNSIVKMTTSGVQTAFIGGITPKLAANGVFSGITTGPDGNLWFTDNHNDTIGRITPAGVVSTYSTGGLYAPNRIVAGPPGDGGLWFTVTSINAIGHVTTGGIVTGWALGTGTIYDGILLGKDGHLYVVDRDKNAIGQVTIAAGTVIGYSEVSIPVNPFDGAANTLLAGLAQTSDGQLWFTNRNCEPSTLGSIAINATFTSSKVNQFSPLKGCSGPHYMAVTPDGAAIFESMSQYPVIEEAIPNAVGAAPTLADYAFQALTPNTVFQATWDITIGPDGNVWSTIDTNDIGGNPPSPANVVELAY